MRREKAFALLVDVDNLNIDLDLFESIIGQVQAKGDILYGKVYGYTDRKSKPLLDTINKHGFDIAPVSRSKRRGKSSVDQRQLIDAVEIAAINENIDSICVVAGDGDLVPLFSKLKELGMFVVGGFNSNEDNASMCHELIAIDLNGAASLPKFDLKKPQFSPLKERPDRPRPNPPARPAYDKINNIRDAERAVADSKNNNPDVFFEIEKLVKDFIKENEKEK
jgi:uncharacterized protein (TIGR00288 family)